MRILQLIASRNFAGSEQFVLTLSLELQKRGHEIFIGVKPGGILRSIYEKHGLNVIDEKMVSIFNTSALSRFVKKHKIDIVHAHLTTAVRVAVKIGFKTGVPVVAHAHIFKNDKAYVKSAEIGALIANSKTTSDFYLNTVGIPKEKVLLVYNSTRVQEHVVASMDKEDVRRELVKEFSVNDDAQFISMLGRVVPQKGQDTLLQALVTVLQKHKNIHTLIAGPTKRKPSFVRNLAKFAKDNGISENVHFLGLRTDIEHIIRGSAIHVAPSRFEPFGLVVIEGMMLRTPVIGTSVDGIAEILNEQNIGMLISPEDSDAFATSILKLLDDEEFAKNMAENAYKNAMSRFTPAIMTDKIEEIYQDLLIRDSSR